MATSTPRVDDTDSLANLEERIARAVHLITQLRQERDTAVSERDQLQAENARLTEELQHLRADRKQVRTRIEKLLGQMDLLSGS
jgi:regulator of replication initiation timing